MIRTRFFRRRRIPGTANVLIVMRDGPMFKPRRSLMISTQS
jgi:hypothetical protein